MGRPDFSQPGSRGSGQTVATTSRPELQNVERTETDSVASGAAETLDMYPPAGSVYNLLNLNLFASSDADATSGSHRMAVRPLAAFSALQGESNYNSNIRFSQGYWRSADVVAHPTTEASQSQLPATLRATENAPVRFVYVNDTDAAQENDRTYQFIAEESTY